MTMTICPACGYPKIGLGLCAACLPINMLTDDQPTRPMKSASLYAAAELGPAADWASPQAV